jgi:hypothetical protein
VEEYVKVKVEEEVRGISSWGEKAHHFVRRFPGFAL